MGKNKTPTAVLDAKGTFITHKDRQRPNEPTTDRPLGNPPSELSKDETKRWKQLASQALPGVLFESDRLMFAVMVRLATKFYNNEKITVAETAQMITLSSKFAMNPADRSRVSVAKSAKSGLAAFLGNVKK
jgi:hypothetical protein